MFVAAADNGPLRETIGRFIFHEKWTLANGELALLAAAAGAYIIAFTVARYASPAGHAGSIPDVSRPA